MLMPCIHLMNGKAVLLKQGLEKVFECDNVVELVDYYSKFGEVTIIDIDATVGNGDNVILIEQLCKDFPCRVGGGIRDEYKAKSILSFGAQKIIIGTAANESLLSKLPQNKVLVALDVQNGYLCTHGWTRVTSITPVEQIKKMNAFCSGFVYTDTNKEGMLNGSDYELIKQLRLLTPNEIVYAGGISSLEEIKLLNQINVSTQLGYCLHSGVIDLKDAFCECLNFEKRFGYIPTVVQDFQTKQVLMIEYSTKESLIETFKTNNCTYFDRLNNKLWVKGEVSGNTQSLVRARFNQNLDAILFYVQENGNAGKYSQYSTFESKHNSLNSLFENIVNKKRILPDNDIDTSYFKQTNLLNKHIMENAYDVVSSSSRVQQKKYISRLLKKILILMCNSGITPSEIINCIDNDF